MLTFAYNFNQYHKFCCTVNLLQLIWTKTEFSWMETVVFQILILYDIYIRTTRVYSMLNIMDERFSLILMSYVDFVIVLFIWIGVARSQVFDMTFKVNICVMIWTKTVSLFLQPWSRAFHESAQVWLRKKNHR